MANGSTRSRTGTWSARARRRSQTVGSSARLPGRPADGDAGPGRASGSRPITTVRHGRAATASSGVLPCCRPRSGMGGCPSTGRLAPPQRKFPTPGACGVNQPRGTLPAPSPRWGSAALLQLRASAIVAALLLVLAGCDRGHRDQTASVSDAWPPASGPPATVEPYVQARPWASSKAAGQAFGRIWREQTRNSQDRDGRGIDAYRWAIRTCDAVRKGGQSPDAMIQRVRDATPPFTEQGAKVIVAAALRALCPDDSAPTQLPP
jgi:hypothetical protein